MSTGLFQDEEDGYNIGEGDKLEETKYKLKLDNPNPASSVPDNNEMPEDSFSDDTLDSFEDASGSDGNDKPFDDEPFDAEVEADEDEDPEKYIQQLAGKLGTTLRKYTEDKGEPDFELEKFAINSVISATNSSEMDKEDQKDIINKVKNSETNSNDDDNDEFDGDLDDDNDDDNDEFGDDFSDDEISEIVILDEENVDWGDESIKESVFRDKESEIKSGKSNLKIYHQKPDSHKPGNVKKNKYFNSEELISNNSSILEDMETIEPVVKPTTKPTISPSEPREKRIWKPKPSVSPTPKAVEVKIDVEDYIDNPSEIDDDFNNMIKEWEKI